MVQAQINNKKVIVIAGPTGIGKSSIAVQLSKKFNGSVVSADSMQIYKGMDIGTGKISITEMDGIEHYMLDIANPDEYFTVFDYVNGAKKAINKIISSKRMPFIVGGTGLYISGLLNGNNFAETSKNPDIRKKLEIRAEEEGLHSLYEYLQKVDPISAEKISFNDKKRIIRALEIFEATGKPKSQNATFTPNSEYHYLLFVIVPQDREQLYKDIERRVDTMIASGLIEEVKKMSKYKNCNSLQAIGYKEIIAYLEGENTLETAIAQIKQNSRRYAKRQLTYFKNMKNEKIMITKNDNIVQSISDIIKDFI